MILLPIAGKTQTNARSRTVPYAGGFFTGLCNRFDRTNEETRLKILKGACGKTDYCDMLPLENRKDTALWSG